jgi:pimeloyl-ACP methyl ester carboxylesterase
MGDSTSPDDANVMVGLEDALVPDSANLTKKHSPWSAKTKFGAPYAPATEGPIHTSSGATSQTAMSDGWTLHSERFSLPEGEIPVGIVQYHHGWCESCTHSISIRRTAKAFNDAGYEVVAYDSHAHGLSLTKKDAKTNKDKIVKRGSGIEGNIVNAKHTLEFFEKEVLPRCKEFNCKFIVAGLSMGAATSFSAYDGLQKLCKENNIHFAFSLYLAPAMQTSGDCCAPLCMPCDLCCATFCTNCSCDIKRTNFAGPLHTEGHEDFFARMYCTALCVFAFRSAKNGTFPTQKWVQDNVHFDAESRFMIISGEMDELAFPSAVKKLHSSLGGEERGELHIVKGMGHEQHSERIWKRVMYEVAVPAVRVACEGGRREDYFKEAEFFAEHGPITTFFTTAPPAQEVMGRS